MISTYPDAGEFTRFRLLAAAAVKDVHAEREKISGSPLPAEFDIVDHIMTLKVQISPLKKDHFDVMKACLNANRVLFPEAREVQSTEELIRNLNQAKTRLRLWRSSSARAGADDALMFIMSWHVHVELHKIQTLREGSSWMTNPDLIKIREEVANFMAEFANTTHLDLAAPVYSDEEVEV